MKFILSLFFISFITIIHCESIDISALIKKLNKVKLQDDSIERDTQLVWHYNYISEELSRHMDPRSEAYLDTLESIATSIDWDSALGFYYRAMGRYNDFKGNFTQALSYYDQAINELKPAGGALKELAFTYVLKGFLLSNSELQQECWETLEEGLPYARQAVSKNSLCLILDWFGDYYYYGLDGAFNNEKALDYYSQVAEILPQISYQRIIADNYAVLSGVYGRLGREKEGKIYFEKADSLTKSANLPHTRWGLYAEKARVLESNGKHFEANAVYLKTVDFMEQSTNIEFKSRLEKALWQNYKNLGNYKKALEHYEAMNEMEAQMATDEVQKKYLEIEAKYDFAIKEHEISDLQKSKLKSNRNLLLALLSITLLGGIIIWRKNSALSEKAELLQEKQNEIQGAIYQGETQERLRIATELHDNVNTKLAAARWQLEAINDDVQGTNKEIVESTIVMMNDAYQDVRNISHNLVPYILESEGLISAVTNLIHKLNINENSKFELVNDPIDESRIKNIAYPLYNIIFELINNVMKHAHAEKTIVKIENQRKALKLTVKDNGKGFSTEKVQHGFGLRSISNRVKSLNGTLNIKSELNQGTTTTVDITIF